MDRPTLQEQLDACRSAADVVGDPNLRELAETLANDPEVAKQLEEQIAFDARMTKGLANVSPPHDLKAKLAAAFRQGAALQEQDRSRMGAIASRVVETVAAEGSPTEPTVEKPKGIISPKRRFLGKTVAGMFAVTASLALFFVFFRNPSSMEVTKTEPELANLAYSLCAVDGGSWNSSFSGVPEKLTWNIRAIHLNGVLQPQRWRKVDPKLPGNWVVWELNSTKGERVYLLASDAAWKPNLISARPLKTPSKSSGTWSVGVWSQGGVTYAVVVEGDANRFGSLIREQENARFERRTKQKLTRTAA